jgi:hypothetical protein
MSYLADLGFLKGNFGRRLDKTDQNGIVHRRQWTIASFAGIL